MRGAQVIRIEMSTIILGSLWAEGIMKGANDDW